MTALETMPPPGLTRRQRDVFNFIDDYTMRHGYGPSFSEIRDAVGDRSNAGAQWIVAGLEERGYVRRFPNRARSIEIIAPFHWRWKFTPVDELQKNALRLPSLRRAE